MKNFFKNQKGINLITLSITIVVILILTNIILYNVKDNLGVQNLKNMQADIENLREKVSSYYMQYGDIPVYYIKDSENKNEKVEYKNTSKIDVISEKIDTGKFYVIDLSALDNLTLNYGQDYEEIKNSNFDSSSLSSYDDLYIINENSHNIFYVEGIEYDGERFYTDYTKDNVDSAEVNLINVEDITDNWSPTYDKSATYKDVNEDIAYIPEGFQVSRKQGEDTINSGLVIKNSQTEDKYVWISVPKSIFKTATSETDYEGIQRDIKTYTTDYSDDNCSDTYYEGCGIASESEYNELKNKLLSSIYKNNGFWISQYEMGTETIRTNTTVSKTTEVSKEGKYPYNYVTIEEAQNLASELSTEDYTTSLMFGMQWDLVLKYIEVRGVKEKSEIIDDSSKWGNYINSEFELTKGMYLYSGSWNDVTEAYSKETNMSVLLSTGAIDKNKVLNIYDFAGNVEEWTLETSLGSSIARGGTYEEYGNKHAASSRSLKNSSELNYNIGFRVALY